VAQDETRDRLSGLLTAPLLALGLDLEAVEITPAGKRRLLRVAVDKDGGVTMDDLASATKQVDRLLDDSGAMGEQPYLLEVTSPGIDRPLTLPRHWRRNQSRLVKVTTGTKETITGRITESDDERVVLDVNGKARAVAYDDVAKARVQVEFNRKDKESDDA
jgi:ribosome maturation factor RimP